MASRSNRRILVVLTYLFLLGLMAAVLIVLPLGDPLDAAWMCVILAYVLVSRAVFGRLVKDMVLPEIRLGQIAGLGLEPRPNRNKDELDEREVAVRNAAHFDAFRWLAIYSIGVWIALPFFSFLSASEVIRVLQLASAPTLAMAYTLPQALILWNEPDVPGEAKMV